MLTVDPADGPRRKNTREQLANLPFDWRFVEGYTKENVSETSEYSLWRNLVFSKRSMTAGEIAVYQGHRKIWRRLIESDREAALVVEDDFSLVDIDSMLVGVAEAMARRDRWDIVKLFDYCPKPAFGSEEWGQVRVVYHKHPASGCVAYLINREAASRLLLRETIYRPVDEDIAHPWEARLRVWSQTPNPVREIAGDLGGSLLEEERFRMRRRRSLKIRSVYGQVLAFVKRFHAASWRAKMKAQQ